MDWLFFSAAWFAFIIFGIVKKTLGLFLCALSRSFLWFHFCLMVTTFSDWSRAKWYMLYFFASFPHRYLDFWSSTPSISNRHRDAMHWIVQEICWFFTSSFCCCLFYSNSAEKGEEEWLKGREKQIRFPPPALSLSCHPQPCLPTSHVGNFFK